MAGGRHPDRTALARRAAVLVLLACAALPRAAAQGLRRDSNAKLGSSSSYSTLAKIYANSNTFAQAYKLNRRGACSATGSSLCAGSSDADTIAALTVAASPRSFDARSPSDTGGLFLASPVRDQGRCSACTGFAMAAAAEAAVSAATRKSAVSRVYSAQDITFCGAAGSSAEIRSCSSSMSMTDALKTFNDIARARGVVLESCLPYDAPNRPAGDDMCDFKCKDVDPDAQGGTFRYVQLATPWEIQAHIRAWGGALTRMDVFSDLKPFFAADPSGTYTGPAPGATFQEAHAVLIVGYDNALERWLVRNSWGKDFGMGGYMWVSYKASGTGIASSGDTYGLLFTPKVSPRLPGSLSPAPAANPGCWSLVPPPNTWPSTIATQFNIPLQRLLLDNIENIQDLERPVDGKTILLCGVSSAVIQRVSGGAVAPNDPTLAVPTEAPASSNGAPGCDPDNAPLQVENLAASGVKAVGGGKSEITLSFDAPGGRQCIKRYEVNAVDATGGGSEKESFVSDARSGITHTFSAVSGKPYLFDVSAVNDAGSSPSRSVTVRP